MWVRCATVVMSSRLRLHHHMCLSSNAHVCMHVRLSEWPRKLCCISLIVFPQLISLTSWCLLLSTLCASVRSESSPGIYLVTLCFFISPHGEAKGHRLLWHIYVSPWLSSLPSLSPSHCFFLYCFNFPTSHRSLDTWSLSLLACLCLCFVLWLVVCLHTLMADKVWHKKNPERIL